MIPKPGERYGRVVVTGPSVRGKGYPMRCDCGHEGYGHGFTRPTKQYPTGSQCRTCYLNWLKSQRHGRW